MEIPDGFAQVNLKFAGAALPTGAEVTLGLDRTGYALSPDNAATEIKDQFEAANLDNRFSLYATLVAILVKYGPTDTGPSAELGVDIPGTMTGDSVTPQVSALVRKTTAFGGRAGRGRLYWPAITEEVSGGSGALDPDFRTDLENSWNEFGIGLEGHDLRPVVLHAAGSPITTPTPILYFTVDGRVATQRRRNRR